MLNRRDFARALSVAAAGTAAALTVSADSKPVARTARPVIKPKKLSTGDTVGIVVPATAAMQADEIYFAKDQMEALGFKVELGKHVFDKWGYFGGHDRDRAEDINQMFASDKVDGIVCFTGGWGSPRVLPYLDYDLIAKHPKVIIGYSDVTALINPIHQRTGLVTFHGPVGESTFDPYTLENFRRVVMTAQPAGLLQPPSKKPNDLVDRVNRIIKIRPGKASGRLVGGNLTMVTTLMGTPYEIDTTGAIFFLEDIHEELYRIDRMLTQLAEGGKFDSAAGVIFGRCTDCKYSGPTFSLEEILQDRFGLLRIPVISGLAFGHIESKLTMPVGVMATLDGDNGTVTIDEAAVV